MGGRLKTVRYDFYKTSEIDVLLAGYLKIDGTNIPTADYSWTTNLTTTGKGTFGSADITGQVDINSTTMPQLTVRVATKRWELSSEITGAIYETTSGLHTFKDKIVLDDGTQSVLLVPRSINGKLQIGGNATAAAITLTTTTGTVTFAQLEANEDHIQFVPGASKGVYFFEDSTGGNNKEVRIYGEPNGVLKYGSFQITRPGTQNFFTITTDANTLNLTSARDIRIGDDGTTNHAKFSNTGNLHFVGTGGLTFSQIYAHNAAVGITSIAQNDWDQITAFDSVGEENVCAGDAGNDHIVVTEAGKYFVSWHWSGNGPAAGHDWDFHIAMNNRATDFPQTSAHLTTPITQNLVSTSGSGIIDATAATDTIELWVQRLSAGANIVLTTENCSITITQIGGT